MNKQITVIIGGERTRHERRSALQDIARPQLDQIIGQPIGRLAVSQLGIFLMVLSAALLHSIGRVLQRRLSHSDRLSSLGP